MYVIINFNFQKNFDSETVTGLVKNRKLAEHYKSSDQKTVASN